MNLFGGSLGRHREQMLAFENDQPASAIISACFRQGDAILDEGMSAGAECDLSQALTAEMNDSRSWPLTRCRLGFACTSLTGLEQDFPLANHAEFAAGALFDGLAGLLEIAHVGLKFEISPLGLFVLAVELGKILFEGLGTWNRATIEPELVLEVDEDPEQQNEEDTREHFALSQAQRANTSQPAY